jgi:hypothetical protein
MLSNVLQQIHNCNAIRKRHILRYINTDQSQSRFERGIMVSTAHKLNENGIPGFEDLPLREGDPHHSAWGLYGKNDELGTLNRLTDARVVEAAKAEIQSGIRLVVLC